MLKNNNRFASNGVFHAMQKTGFVGAGVNGRHRMDMSEVEKRHAAKKAGKGGKKHKGRDLFEPDAEPDADEFDPKAADGDMDDTPDGPVVHMKRIAKHAKTLRKVAVDIGDRISEMHRMGLE